MNRKVNISLLSVGLIIGTLVVVLYTSTPATTKLTSQSKVLEKSWKAPAVADDLRNPLSPSPSVLRNGENLYNTYCQSCHGTTGLGDGSPGKFKIEPANFHSKAVTMQTDGALYWKITNGRGVMPAFKDALSEELRWQLVAYIRQLAKQGASSVSSASNRNLPAENYKIDLKIQGSFFALPKKLTNVVKSEFQLFTVDTVITHLDRPWSMTFLPNKSVLITERRGKLLLFANGKTQGIPIAGNIPKGLRDIKLDPQFGHNKQVYLSYYTDPTESEGGNTILMRGKLEGNKLVNEKILYKAGPFKLDGEWYGSKIAFDNEGHLFFTVGIRGKRLNAQDLSNPQGKTMRFNKDGTIPRDNPFTHVPGALPEIYSYGHRMHEGLTRDPKSGKIFSTEFGELGGDELNVIRPGDNYGWPLATYSLEYNGSIISKTPIMKGVESPIYHFAIAPSDLAFVYGKSYPGWDGDVFVGGLASKTLHRMVLKNGIVIHDETLLQGIGRVRDVKYAPDDCLYIMVEDVGMVVRLIPVSKR